MKSVNYSNNRLQRAYKFDKNMKFVHVNMGECKISNKDALYTWGALPCLNVVVHDGSQHKGGLAHIAHDDLNQNKLFEKAITIINEMTKKIGIYNQYFDIWLGAGAAFSPNYNQPNHYITSFANEDFFKAVTRNFPNAEILDDRLGPGWKTDVCPGDVAYSPSDNKLYFLDEIMLRHAQENPIAEKNDWSFIKSYIFGD